ncbi:MAG TPA: hypothetical protein VKW78_00885 [Terriglobales bacterium]|nr:hypothetical protein [Terriglobales bacterium]
MARGWESKSVEEQQSEFAKSSENKGARSPEEEKRMHLRKELQLKRARVLEQLQRSQNARYTELLNRELQEVERDLASTE